MIDNEHEFMRFARWKYSLQHAKARLDGGEDVNDVVDNNQANETAEQVLEACRKSIGIAEREMASYDAKVNQGRKGHWNPTFSGRRFWPEDPRPEEIAIADIAHCLARINRFNGHTNEPYSVAQHSMLVSAMLPDDIALFGLLHDAGECYLGDIITPIKRLFREFYEPVEDKVMRAVAERYGFEMTEEDKARVKKADLAVLYAEIRDLCPSGCYNGDVLVPPCPWVIERCWSPWEAEARFYRLFMELTDG